MRPMVGDEGFQCPAFPVTASSDNGNIKGLCLLDPTRFDGA